MKRRFNTPNQKILEVMIKRAFQKYNQKESDFYYVKYNTRLTQQQLNQKKSEHNLKLIKHATKKTGLIPSAANVVIVESSNVRSLKQDPNVVLVEKVPVYEPNQFNDPISNMSLQTSDFNRVNYLEAIEAFGVGNHYPTVGQVEGRYEGAYHLKRSYQGSQLGFVVDYFERYEHPDMPDSKVTVHNEELLNPLTGGMWNGANPRHAFQVASLIIGETNNNYGMAGYCPNANLYFVSNYNSNSAGTYGIPAQCEALLEQGIKVINRSAGGTNYSQVDQDAINDAYEQGLVWVASAGNDNQELGVQRNQYPCMYDNVFCVAGSEYGISNYGLDYCDVSAPSAGNLVANMSGTNMGNTYDEFGNPLTTNDLVPGLEQYNLQYGPYRTVSGTSFGTPIVTALMGLLLSHNPDLTNEDLVNIVLATIGSPLGGSQPVPGEVNFYEALSYMYANYMGEIPLGDVNQDYQVNVVDTVNLVNLILEVGGGIDSNHPQYIPQGDINQDGSINVVDVVNLINMILRNSDTSQRDRRVLQKQLKRLSRWYT